jgi:hypothetical protein
MTRKSKSKRRRKHSPEEPLVAPGTALRLLDKPAPSRPWVPPLRGLVRALPSHAETRRGRETAVFIRLIIGVAAVMMVTKGREHWAWGLAGVATALSSLLVPLGETRRRRWLRRLDALLESTSVLEPRPAQVDFDGRKVSIRVEGRVWRSLRPFDPPCSTHLLKVDDTLWLGLLPPEGRKRDSLWFCTPAAPLADQLTRAEPGAEPPEAGMTLDADGFIAVHEAFLHRL